MQKGTMMTGIVDACAYINAAFARIARRSKEGGMFTEAENNYIASVFTDMTKDVSQYIEKVKELLAPKQPVSEEETLATLGKMHAVMRSYTVGVKKFEKDFEALAVKRSKRLTDIEDVKKIFKIKPVKELPES